MGPLVGSKVTCTHQSCSYLKLTEIAKTTIGTPSKGGIKEKNEDANYDYDMVWDAKGVMHLIQKGYSKISNANHGKSRSSIKKI